MKNQYVFIIDPQTGERKATYLVGVHGSLEEILQKAADEYPGNSPVEGNDEMFNDLVGKNMLYINGECVERPPYVQPLEDVIAAKLTELKGIRDAKELEPVQYGDNLFDFDTKSFDRINAAIIALDQTHGTIGWTTADNTVVEVTADTLRGVIAAAAARSNLLHIRYRELKESITAATDKATVLSTTWE